MTPHRILDLTDAPPGTFKQEDIDRANLVFRRESNGLVTLFKNRFTAESVTSELGLVDLLHKAREFEEKSTHT
jgi:hypothetical protein